VDVRLFCKFVITCLWLSTDHEQEDEATDGAPNQSKLRVWPLVKILKALPSTSTIFLVLFFSLPSQLHNKMQLLDQRNIYLSYVSYIVILIFPPKDRVVLAKKAYLLFIGDVQMDLYILTFFPHPLAC
jgi:hypothetical protein